MTKGWLIGGAAFLGVLLIASIVVALLDGEDTLPEGTAEATVQQYFKATQSGDYQSAYSFLASDLKTECSIDQFAGNNPGRFDNSRDSRIVLKDSAELDDGVTLVRVDITQFYRSGPFGSNESTFEQSFTLREEEGDWKFTQYPWPYYNCPVIDTRAPAPAIVVTATSTPEPEPDDDTENSEPAAP